MNTEPHSTIQCQKFLRLKKTFRYFLLLLFISHFAIDPVYADGVAFGLGKGSRVRGARFSYQKTSYFFSNCRDYWEISLAYIRASRKKCDFKMNRQLTGGSLIYVVQFGGPVFASPFDFYVEGGAGLAGYNKQNISNRQLGSNVLLEFKLGGGFVLNRHFDLGIKWIHNSNAYLSKHNDGLSIGYLILTYKF